MVYTWCFIHILLKARTRYRDSVDDTVEEGELQRLLINPNALVAVSKGMRAVKLCTNVQQNPPVLNWRCWLI